MRILLVEDVHEDALLMLHALKTAGVEVDWQRVSSESELHAALTGETWDVALVDYSLPGYSGLEALRTLSDLAPDTQCITVSGTISEDTAVATMNAGAVDYVLKDHLARLVPAVRTAVDRGAMRRRELQAAKRARQSQYAVDNAASIIAFIDEQGTVLYTNKAGAALAGIAPEQTVGNTLWGWSPQVDEAAWAELWSATAAGNVELELPLTLPSGEVRVAAADISRLDEEQESFVVVNARDVTSQRRAERELRAERSNLAAIFASSPVALLVLDSDLRVVRVNTAALRLTGARAEQLLEHEPASTLMPGDALGCPHSQENTGCGTSASCPLCPLRNTLVRLVDEGVAVIGADIEMTLTVDDEMRDVWLRIGSHRITIDGDPHVIVALDDVTERRRAERTLVRQTQMLARAEAVAHVGSWRMDLSSGHLEWSDEMYRTFGLDPATFSRNVGDAVALAVHPDDRAKLEETNAAVMKDGIPRPLTYRVVQPTGDVRWVYACGEQERDDTGEVVALAGFVQDVTDRLRAEEGLRHSEERYRSLFEQSPVAMWEEDYSAVRTYLEAQADGPADDVIAKVLADPAMYGQCLALARGVETNLAAVRLFHAKDAQELLARDADLYGPGSTRGTHHFWRAMLAGEPSAQFEETNLTLAGEKIDILQCSVVVPGHEATFDKVYTTNIDITERKRAERAAHSTAEQLRRTLEGSVRAMSQVVETRDPYTAGHQRRVAQLSAAIAAELGMPATDVGALRLAALIHDIGKIAVPAEILSKPGQLSAVEFRLVQQHVQHGFAIVESIEFDRPVAEMMRQHHERLDGSGYPRALTGHEVMLEARILGVADVVEAMSSHRPYRPSLGMDRALEEVRAHAGVKYDADVVAACERIIAAGFRLED